MKEERRTGRQRKEKCTGGTARGKAQALQSYVGHWCVLSVFWPLTRGRGKQIALTGPLI